MQSQNEEPFSLPTGTRLCHFNGVPVIAQADFWPAPVILTALLAWVAGLRKPERSWPQCLGVALLAMPVALFADIGHAMAHTISARIAGAPMDEILLSSGMPRTLYKDNAVPPKTHIQRSLGGPIFSLTGFTLSLLGHLLTESGSLARDLSDASLAGHSFILLGSLAPLPMVDGGVILKWKLVEAGQSPEQADQTVRKTSLRVGAGFLGLGIMIGLIGKRKLAGSLLAAGGIMGIAAAKEWLK